MATSAEIGLAALGAFAASEATGVTDVTGLGGGGGDEGGDSGGGGSSPGLGALASRVAGLQGSVAAAVSERPSSGVGQTDLADAFGELAENAATPNTNVVRTIETVRDAADATTGDTPQNVVEEFTTGVPDGARDEFNEQTGGGSGGDGSPVREFLNDPTGVAESAGETTGRTPVAFGTGVVQGASRESLNLLREATVGSARRGSEFGEDLGGDINEAIWGQRQDPLTEGIVEGSRPDAIRDALAGGVTGDADTSILGAQLGPGVTGPVDAGGESARQAASAVATAGGGDTGPMDDTTSTGDTTRERDRENRDELDDVRRAAAAGRRRIGVVR